MSTRKPKPQTKFQEHASRQMLARCLSQGNIDKLARMCSLPLFDVAMEGRAVVFGKKQRRAANNLPQRLAA